MNRPRGMEPIQPQVLVDRCFARRVPIRQIRASSPFSVSTKHALAQLHRLTHNTRCSNSSR